MAVEVDEQRAAVGGDLDAIRARGGVVVLSFERRRQERDDLAAIVGDVVLDDGSAAARCLAVGAGEVVEEALIRRQLGDGDVVASQPRGAEQTEIVARGGVTPELAGLMRGAKELPGARFA